MSTVDDSRSRPSTTEKAKEPVTGGLLAAFRSAADVVSVARAFRDAGYRALDVHSPHPIHGLDAVLSARPSPLPWVALLGAAIGLAGGIWMAWWMNAVDYPFLISGKPLFALAPSLPVAFELAILLSAFAVFGGALALAGLPSVANRKFRVPAFARATDDQYFLAIDSRDARFDRSTTRDALLLHGALSVDDIPIESHAEHRVPRWIRMAGAVLLVLALIPPVMIARARTTVSSVPRLSFINDMDHQPKFKAQNTSPLFPDGRGMRPQVPGTIAVGDLQSDTRYFLGVNPDPAADSASADDIVRTSINYPADESPNAGAPPDWVTDFPLDVDSALMRRGQQRYEIFCATCHGLGGDGDGLVTRRALELEQGTWVRPTSLHAEPIREQPNGQLFHTISNGVRRMPGYASQIPVRDRWAIVAWLRALQRTRTATAADVPEDILPTLRDLK